mmetsp:Transcript_4114/g.12175  ORF Transcript_4114/g.12175 Transcript_4114/m.12175 type:complete len:271 (+) Transcript_4114:906-1718(+)
MLVARDSDALPQPEFARNAAAEDCFGATGVAAGTAAVVAAVAAAGAARKAETDDAGAAPAAGTVGCGGAVGCRAVAAPAEADAPLGRAACFTFARSFRSASTATRETVSEAPAPAGEFISRGSTALSRSRPSRNICSRLTYAWPSSFSTEPAAPRPLSTKYTSESCSSSERSALPSDSAAAEPSVRGSEWLKLTSHCPPRHCTAPVFSRAAPGSSSRSSTSTHTDSTDSPPRRASGSESERTSTRSAPGPSAAAASDAPAAPALPPPLPR